MLTTSLKVLLAVLSVVIIVSTLLAPSSERSLEGVFTGRTGKPTKKPRSIRIAWLTIVLWLMDTLAIALLKG